jgi:hypothetical protein
MSWRRHGFLFDFEPSRSMPCHTFHVLRGEQELQSALLRAVESERGRATMMEARADRYESMLSSVRTVQSVAEWESREQAEPASSVGIARRCGAAGPWAEDHLPEPRQDGTRRREQVSDSSFGPSWQPVRLCSAPTRASSPLSGPSPPAGGHTSYARSRVIVQQSPRSKRLGSRESDERI